MLVPRGEGVAWVRGRLAIADGRIARVEVAGDATDGDLAGARVFAPGLIDLHVHGFGGWSPTGGIRVGAPDASGSQGVADQAHPLEHMAAALARAGTTAFQPTLFPAAPAALAEVVRAVHRAARALPTTGAAHVLGLHLEGPFVSPLAAGALPLADLAEPSPAALDALFAGLDDGAVRTVTLAPELAGAADLCAELGTRGVRPSLGHSRATAADGRALVRAAPETAFGITHLYNAMSGVHHRDPGLAHFALTGASLFVELIGDLVHVGREGIELALAARGPAHLCLVSDALAGAGTGCDVFHACGRDHVVEGGAAYYPGPPRQLAGSACSQWEMVQRLTSAGVVSLAEALQMATHAPARALGIQADRGVLAVGAAADLLELEVTPEGPELRGVWVAGQRVPGVG